MENKMCKCGVAITEENRVYKGIKNGKKTYRSHCTNCENSSDRIQKKRKHRITTAKRLRREFDAFKETLYCTDCKIPFKDQPWICDFHHLDPNIKDRTGRGISYLVQLNTKERLQKELEKCVPLCSNCHRTRHHFLDNKQVFRSSNSFKEQAP